MQKLTRQDIDEAAYVLAAGFKDDPFFSHLLPDETNRLQALTLLLKRYVDLLYDYGNLYASSARMEALALVYRPHQMEDRSSFWQLINNKAKVYLTIAKSVPVCREIGIKQFTRLFQIMQTMNSKWLNDFIRDDCAHLEFLVVQKPYRGHGLAKKMVSRILGECKKRGIVCSLETHNPKNVGMYKHFDFELVDKIRMPDSDLVQYCMLYNR